ncbi:hypothetical protein LTR37_000907 [Vermiconidia calcicola]|uniref:Uncharacterized protein n=1 Tax=Vermiconidia calcicola TaxID=1690605 RepID=A0ACC3P033_9PEZI|nr:hypothetical protein LTR37_000907 [Vermiconidia calcicola]
MNNGNKLLNRMLLEQRKLSTRGGSVSPYHVDGLALKNGSDAIDGLAHTLEVAESIHERYTSEYAPDARSLRFNRGMGSELGDDSPSGHPAPALDETGQVALDNPSDPGSSHSHEHVLEDDDEEDHVWPLEILTTYIEAYHERANREREQGHYNQAEVNLQWAIRHSELRERHYHVAFDDRARIQEEIAILYQKQGKFADAVAKVHQLLGGSRDDSAQARQQQLLGSIYYDRYLNRNGSLSHTTNDIENAERYMKKAFKKYYKMLKSPDVSNDDVEKHYTCVELLVRILETGDKTVEATELTKLLLADGSAIKTGDTEQVQNVVANNDVNIEQLCRQGKTPLMWAVEKGDETIVHKLLDPAVGADVNTCNKKGITAIHAAASVGAHDLLHCLLLHDAEKDARDRRGETPLLKAVQNNQRTALQILYDANADIFAKNTDEWTALHFAVRLSKTDMINLLLDLAPDLKDAVDTAGKTALAYAADLELVDQAAALLVYKNNADVNAWDSVSRTPLYLATSKPPTPRRESMVQLLIKYGATVDETRPPPRYRDYVALRHFQASKRTRKLSRHDSISTSCSTGTAFTGVTKLSRIFSSRMHM